MLVCSCKWLTSQQLQEIIVSGAASLQEIGRRCGAGTECGGCSALLQELLDCTPQPDTCCDRTADATGNDLDSSAA